MYLTLIIFALFSALTHARPAPKQSTASDGRGATIYTSPNFTGSSTAIPGNNYCTNLNNIFGNFDARTRSIITAVGYQCKFFLDYDCPSSSSSLSIGTPLGSQSVPNLPSNYDSAIHSVICSVATG